MKKKIFMKSAGTRGYSRLARVLTAIVMMFTLATTGAWADITITWGPAELSSLTDDYLPAGATKTVNGITVTVNAGTNNFLAVSEAGTVFSATNDNAFTFSTELGNFTKIECTSLSLSGTLGDGWDGATWTGDANSVNMSKAGSFLAVSSITFTIGEPAAPVTYKVTMKEGTADAGKWTIEPTEAKPGTKITATYSGTKHVKSVTAVVKAAAPAGHALSASAVGEVVGTDGLAYAVADKDNLPTGVTAAGVVAYKSGSNGLVIALADEASTMNWSTANGATTGAAAHTPAVSGQTWKLPSQDEWKQMFSANGGSEGSYSGLNTTITNAGGTAFQEDGYWSSTVNDEVNAYSVGLYGGSAYFDPFAKDADILVRACLAF